LHANAFYEVLCGHEKHETDEHDTKKVFEVKKRPWNNGKIETKNRGLVIGNGQRPVDTCGM